MTREMRWRLAGLLFYFTFILGLIVSRSGLDFIRNVFANYPQLDVYQAVVVILTAGAGLFTSDAVGFVMTTFTMFWWEAIRGGYSAEYEENLSYNLKDIITERYVHTAPPNIMKDENLPHYKFFSNLTTYKFDIVLSYVRQHAPKYIDEWDTRRYNVFFANISSALGLLLGILLSTFLILILNMGWTVYDFGILDIVVLLIVMFVQNAQYARLEGLAMVDLWVAGLVNPHLRTILDTFRPDQKGDVMENPPSNKK